MDKIPISDAELEVMRVLWAQSPASFPEIVRRVKQHNAWEPVTIKTMLNRLVKKLVVAESGSRRNYQYTPLVSREEYRESIGDRLIEQAFDGAPLAMLSFFVKRADISRADLDELQSLIEELKK